MFSGIIQATGEILKTQRDQGSLFLTLGTPPGWRLALGDSVAVNGACLTVAKKTAASFTAELMPETLAKTVFGHTVPSAVNLERPLRLNDFVNGHLVSGHVDAVGSITAIKKNNRATVLTMRFPKKFAPLVVAKGSVALNGVSLTAVSCTAMQITVSLVDYTVRHTTFHTAKKGDLVNIEFDMVGKYLFKKSKN